MKSMLVLGFNHRRKRYIINFGGLKNYLTRKQIDQTLLQLKYDWQNKNFWLRMPEMNFRIDNVPYKIYMKVRGQLEGLVNKYEC